MHTKADNFKFLCEGKISTKEFEFFNKNGRYPGQKPMPKSWLETTEWLEKIISPVIYKSEYGITKN